MPSFTRRAIKETFLRQLEQKPLNQITVKDIVEECGINRNSFYYHFEDLPALLEEIVSEELHRLIETHPTIDSLEEGVDAAVEFILSRKRAVLHIYNSMSRDLFQRYLLEVCQYVAATYIESALAGRTVDEEDKAVLVRYHKCVCFGSILDWLGGGMKDDISAYFHRVYQLKIGWKPVQEDGI